MANYNTGKDHPMFKHGDTSGGKTKEYRAWRHMKSRCFNENVERYPLYGGRGITVCKEWIDSFESFLSCVGRAPSERHQLDRIDNDGNYEPGNVRWVTVAENVKNSRKARKLTHFGVTKTIGEWADCLGINRQTLQMRLDKYGWSVEKTLTTPVLGGRV